MVSKGRKGKGYEYKVPWKSTWPRKSELGNAQEMQREFEARNRRQRRRKGARPADGVLMSFYCITTRFRSSLPFALSKCLGSSTSDSTYTTQFYQAPVKADLAGKRLSIELIGNMPVLYQKGYTPTVSTQQQIGWTIRRLQSD